MARVTRLELATSGVTGRRSNQLSYTRITAWDRLGSRQLGESADTVNAEPRQKTPHFSIAENKRQLWSIRQQHDRGFKQLFDLLDEAGGIISINHAVIAAYRDIH